MQIAKKPSKYRITALMNVLRHPIRLCLASHVGLRSFAKKKKASVTTEAEEFQLVLNALKGVSPQNTTPFTDEEKARHCTIAREYNRMSSIDHNHRARDLQTMIDLKWEAINALPKELQAEALVEDVGPMPPGVFIPSWTPPIPGYKDKDTVIEYRYDED